MLMVQIYKKWLIKCCTFSRKFKLRFCILIKKNWNVYLFLQPMGNNYEKKKIPGICKKF